MKKREIGIWCGLVLFPLLLQAQEETKCSDRIGFEFGGAGFFGKTLMPDRVRASKSASEGDNFFFGLPIPNPNQIVDNMYAGIKYETFLRNDRFGLTAGLRFSQSSSEIRTDWFQDYYIWLFRQNETTTDYLSIRKIRQKSYYLGIPLEFRFLLKKRTSSFFNPYVKLGAAINYRVSTTNSVTFFDSAMTQYAGAVSEQIEKPDAFYAWVYPAFGLKFGKIKNIWFNVEAHFPGFIIKNKALPFIRTDVGIGSQISIQIPLVKSHLIK
ncbi:MAG: PorT family protein [Candidatus Azobacteroides sp.]|nr:PorT family protein [Candidatus Azobacteroides sp.]